MTRFESLVLAATTLVAGSAAQQLASYDPAAVPVQEFAAVSCATMVGYTDDLISPAPAGTWFVGATAADNLNQTLYYATGRPADGILRIAFSDIGAFVAPSVFALPPGLNQLTGMVVDPTVAGGDVLYVTDGYSIGRYDVTAGAWVSVLGASPAPAANYLTGLAYDPFTSQIFAVDDASTIYSRSLSGGAWSAPVFPAAAVPSRPTGIAFCRTAPGTPSVSYWNGVVMDPATGVVTPFPAAPGGVRHHRGLTFMGKATNLGGSGDPQVHPILRPQGPFFAGSANFNLVVESPQLGVLFHAVAAQFAATPNSGVVLPGIGGQLMIDPAQAIMLGIGSGTTHLPLSLVGVPPGIGLTFQAAATTGSRVELSDGIHLLSYLF